MGDIRAAFSMWPCCGVIRWYSNRVNVASAVSALLFSVSFLVLSSSSSTNAQLSDNPEELMNWCLDSTFHKARPTPEPELFAEVWLMKSNRNYAGNRFSSRIIHICLQCSPWSKRACCNSTVSKLIHHNVKIWQGFQLRHCSRPMSAECLQYFRRDFCFYECSPNLGPWVEYVSLSYTILLNLFLKCWHAFNVISVIQYYNS
jgi:folate receptor